MKIEQIDKNFATQNVEIVGDKAVYAIPHESFDLYGIFYDQKEKRFRRMPSEIAQKVSDGVAWLVKNSTGGRLRFSTDSDYFGIDVAYDEFTPMGHMPLSGSCGFVLLEEEDGWVKRVGSFRPEVRGNEEGYSRSIALSGGVMRSYILYFPLYNHVTDLKITLSANAKVEHGKKYKDVAPILYYGSSITQGGCASRPDNAYQALISKWNNIDFINLGFSGSAKAEDAMVDYLASLDCSLYVCDYDYNSPSTEYLQATHYRLYERYRAIKKDTPILFASKPDFNGGNNIDRREVIFQTYKKAREAGDNNVYFIDGETFFGKGDWDRENCTVDGCHPNDLGFFRMAKGFYEKMKEINPVFKGEDND